MPDTFFIYALWIGKEPTGVSLIEGGPGWRVFREDYVSELLPLQEAKKIAIVLAAPHGVGKATVHWYQVETPFGEGL